MFGAAPQDSLCNTHGYSHAEYCVSSSVPYVPRPADRVCEGDRGIGEDQDRVGSLHIEGEADERDCGSRNKRSEVAREVPAPTQKRKKVKASDSEQTEPAEGSAVDSEFIPSYGGHVAGSDMAWIGTFLYDRGSLKFRSHYMALTGWKLTDVHVLPLAFGSGLTHLRSCMFQHSNAALLSAFVERW
ncbi:hypothetical protein M9H77_04488 [Catharanthus roseus]|uniref:Uncharacterized protein n=1 Tax=Catharanthus roseus TaxID=4058 RepID=A0ACC0CED4_CATRO|nr:hypothetical protein M9H77_04488 [Catharanthus roseus]